MEKGQKIIVANPSSTYDGKIGEYVGASIVKDAIVVKFDDSVDLLTFDEGEIESLPDTTIKIVVKGGVVINTYTKTDDQQVKVLDLDDYDDEKDIDQWLNDELKGYFEARAEYKGT